MPMLDVTCDTLGDISEGQGRIVIDRVLRAIKSDLAARGHDGSARKAVITLVAKPINGEDGEMDVAWQVKGKISLPDLASKPTISKLETVDGKVKTMFRDDNAERHDQPSFADADVNDDGEIR